VVIVFASQPKDLKDGNDTWLRKWEPGEVPRYVKELSAFFRDKHADLLAEIRDNPKDKLKGERLDKLSAAMAEFEKQFDGKEAAV
jgi:hypothetical protein